MSSSRLRPAVLVAAISLILAGLMASSASAEVTASQITSPSDPTFLPLDEHPVESHSSSQTVTITGTAITDDANASDSVELGCFYTSEAGTQAEHSVENFKEEPIVLTVHPDGSFTTADLTGEEAATLDSLWTEQPCTLRAVPKGTAGTADVEAFKGPRLGDSGIDYDGPSESELQDDYLATTTLQGYWGWDSAGDCGPYGRVFAPSSFEKDEPWISDCEANLRESNESNTAPSITVGGHTGYDVEAAEDVNGGAPGQPFLKLDAPVLNQENGDLTQTETEEIVRCEKLDGSAVDQLHPGGECEKFVPTGVKLVRTVATGQSGLQATVTDRFESTDGSSHPISVDYGEEQGSGSDQPSYRFPGQSSFSTIADGASAPTGTGAPETVYFQADSEAPDLEDGLEDPRGAITLSSAPDSIKAYTNKELEFTYANRTVPATGSLTVVQILSQALSQSQVESLAGLAETQLAPPTLSVSSPASGATVSTPSVQVSGATSDSLGITSLTINGVGATVQGDGSFSAATTLAVGANTITVVATDSAGRTTSKAVTVNYTPPPVPVVPPAHLSKVGSVSGANGKVTFTLACIGTAGTRCTVKVAVTTIEKLHGKKIKGVVARLRSKRVSLGTVTLSIPAGTKVKISLKLNALGRRLLAHFHKLPVHLSAVLSTPGVQAKTVVAQNVIVHPVKAHKKKHH